jgi:FixJ family two-component response regulator
MQMARGRLLVLDDDATVGKILVFVAESVDFEARLCEQASAFFQAVIDWAPTHVAIDLSMPEVDGVEVLRRLAVNGCRARVIISSGAGRGEIDAALHEAQALGLQTAGALSKPFSLKSLRTLLADGSDATGPTTAS